jgi:hypothetical protein
VVGLLEQRVDREAVFNQSLPSIAHDDYYERCGFTQSKSSNIPIDTVNLFVILFLNDLTDCLQVGPNSWLVTRCQWSGRGGLTNTDGRLRDAARKSNKEPFLQGKFTAQGPIANPMKTSCATHCRSS